MCGIAGILLPKRNHVPKGRIEDMTRTLVHRGPDGRGFYRSRGVALGHRRLNIIDIEGGAQPMANEDETVWVALNGEIYNFKSLRSDLAASGHQFKTNSDTEVLVHGYEEWGEDVLERLNGMFAFAIWDERKRAAFLARDRMGQKPLFYAHLEDGRLLFASEAKALVAHPDLPAAVAPEALATYLTFEYMPGSLSMFAGVEKLPAGHAMTYQAGHVKTWRYWDIPFGQQGPRYLRDATREFTETFRAAVKRRLVSDVPLGIFLSGGIDSSSVAAMVVQEQPPSTVKTFSIGFDDPRYDESDMARLVASHLGTDHRQKVFNPEVMFEVLPRVVDKLDEPFGDASLLPTYLLSEFTREHVTVALGGDGGDELLMGYPTFWADGPATIYRRLPQAMRRFIHRQASRLPVDTDYLSLDFVVKSFLRAADQPAERRHPLWMSSFVPDSGDDPLIPELRRRFPVENVLRPAVEAYRQCHDPRALQRLSCQYAKTYLAEDILVKVDRASMAVSLEARAPFLDPNVVSLLVSLPPRMKLAARWQAKYILKRAMKGVLPDVILKRKKKGFAIPVADWLRGPLKEQLTDLLSPDRLKRAGFLKHEVVDRLVHEHLRERRDNRKQLWTLLTFELWRDRYGIDG